MGHVLARGVAMLPGGNDRHFSQYCSLDEPSKRATILFSIRSAATVNVFDAPLIRWRVAGVPVKVNLFGRKIADLEESEVCASVPAWLLDVGSHVAESVVRDTSRPAVIATAEMPNVRKRANARRTMVWVTELTRMSEAVGVHLRLDVDHIRGIVSAGRRHAARQILGEQVTRTEQCSFFNEHYMIVVGGMP